MTLTPSRAVRWLVPCAALVGAAVVWILARPYLGTATPATADDSRTEHSAMGHQLASEGRMDTNRFWQIIDGARAKSKGDQEAMLNEMRSALGALTPSEIASYQERLDTLTGAAYRWDLWGAAYIMSGGCSDDGFEYFRYWLIAMGRDVYEGAMRDAESLAGVKIALAEEGMIEFESFGYVAMEVYEEKTGGEMPRAAMEPLTEPAGQKWEEDGDDLERRFPKLWKKYAE